MAQREKLIELIGDSLCCPKETDCADCEYKKYELCTETMVADYLLANGVVVVPCKVGDTVYVLSDNDYEEMAVTGITVNMAGDFLIQAECNVHGYGFGNYDQCQEVFCGRTGMCYTQTYSYNIGKTVFFTKKEAERALAKRKGGDE